MVDNKDVDMAVFVQSMKNSYLPGMQAICSSVMQYLYFMGRGGGKVRRLTPNTPQASCSE
jgi:hypothetical protein